MKRILLAGATLLALTAAQPTLAADAPVYKGPAPVAAALFNWGGLYVGGNVGWANQRFDWAFNPPLVAPNQAYSFSGSDVIYGAHAGIQGQWGQWVLGLEVAYSGLGGKYASIPGYGIDPVSSSEARVRNVWTVGPRIGWANNNWLWFVTGGYASGRVETGLRNGGVLLPAFDSSATQNGWFAGVGVDWALTQNVIFGLEYQHIALGSVLHVTPAGGANNHDLKVDIDLVRARLSWLFHM